MSLARTALLAASALVVCSSAAAAQATTAKPMEHKMEHKMDEGHAMSPWKELDGYHMLMMATWHPAKDKGDMAPTRAKIGEMVASAKVLAASKAPKGCDSPKLAVAAKALPVETQGVADLVAKKADDATLKAALKALHEKFDVLEEGCVMPKGEKH
ncbi:MAG: hypothetical protein IT353_16205 [Gemmatimonadaceae bacterium]|nr:hypothetical protein [Gemmatimonadaceae bacterium]